MGCETANVHLGSLDAIKRVIRDIEKRPASWLHGAAKIMSKALMQDWKIFRGGNAKARA
jgi:hypothetical protein